MIRAVAALGVAAAVLAPGVGRAGVIEPLTAQNYVISANNTKYTLLTCSGVGCASGQFTVNSDQTGISITGLNGSSLESASGGTVSAPNAVDTFLEFSITSPIQNVSGLSFSINGCGGNTGSSACPKTTYNDVSGTTVSTFKNADKSGQLATASVTTWDNMPSNSNVMGGIDTFSPQQTVYVTLDLQASARGGYASIDSVVFTLTTVPEPMSAAMFTLGLVGLGGSRRRRR